MLIQKATKSCFSRKTPTMVELEIWMELPPGQSSINQFLSVCSSITLFMLVMRRQIILGS